MEKSHKRDCGKTSAIGLTDHKISRMTPGIIRQPPSMPLAPLEKYRGVVNAFLPSLPSLPPYVHATGERVLLVQSHCITGVGDIE